MVLRDFRDFREIWREVLDPSPWRHGKRRFNEKFGTSKELGHSAYGLNTQDGTFDGLARCGLSCERVLLLQINEVLIQQLNVE